MVKASLVILVILLPPSVCCPGAPVPPPRAAGIYDGTWSSGGTRFLLILRPDGTCTTLFLWNNYAYEGRWSYHRKSQRLKCLESSADDPLAWRYVVVKDQTTVYDLQSGMASVGGGPCDIPFTLKKRANVSNATRLYGSGR